MPEHVKALKGALTYTRRYRNRTFVVKIGGGILGEERAMRDIAAQVALLESLSIRVVLVHGGGQQASDLSRRLGIEPEIVAGRRVTNAAVLEIAKMVYAGKLNVDLLAALQAEGVPGVGLSGVDASLIVAKRRPPVTVVPDEGGETTVDYGEVGDVVKVNPAVLLTLLDKDFVPVVASLAADGAGRTLNLNADTLAESIAVALSAKKLIFMTTSPGLLRDQNDPTSLVPFADPQDLEALLANGGVAGGMRPKVEACIRAVRGGVRRTHIIDGTVPDSLLMEVFTGAGCGTMIVNRKEKANYREQEL